MIYIAALLVVFAALLFFEAIEDVVAEDEYRRKQEALEPPTITKE